MHPCRPIAPSFRSAAALVLAVLVLSTTLPEPARADPGSVYSFTLPLVYFNYRPSALHSVNAAVEPYYPLQWHLNSIRAADAWSQQAAGDLATPVAVIDSGVFLTHPDLQANLLPGVDCSSGVCVEGSMPDDPNGHGTHVAGIIAAAANGSGTLGVAPYAGIIPVRVLDASGKASDSAVIAALAWASSRAKIINLSLGGTTDSTLLHQAVIDAARQGVLMVVAAGNYNNANPFYPAAYPEVLAVGALDTVGGRASFSNFGSFVDVAAPGVDICSTYPNTGSFVTHIGIGWCYSQPVDTLYATMSGTSMATPQVAGLAALLWERHPEYTVDQIRAVIINTGMALSAWSGMVMIRVDQAIAAPAPLVSPAAVTALSAQEVSGLTDRAAEIVPGRVLVRYRDGAVPISLAGTELAQVIPGTDIHVFRVAEGQEWLAVDALRASPDVLSAEPDGILTAQ